MTGEIFKEQNLYTGGNFISQQATISCVYLAKKRKSRVPVHHTGIAPKAFLVIDPNKHRGGGGGGGTNYFCHLANYFHLSFAKQLFC